MDDKRRAPINTQREHDPIGFLLSAMAMGAGGAIEHQEAQGQRSFVASTTLPTKCDAESRKALESAGVKFGDVVDGDPMFQHVELPDGWRKRPTDHSMWSELVDDKGRKRASMFYKAAFYDRDAFMNAERRYGYQRDYDRENENGEVVVLFTDCGKPMDVTIAIESAGLKSYEVSDKAHEAGRNWLDVNYPNWKDAAAYWG